MNILISLSSFDMDGVSTSSISLANELYRKGHNVFIHAINNKYSHTRCRVKKGIDIYVSDVNSYILNFIKRNNIDVIHSHHPDVHKRISEIVKSNKHLKHIATTHGHYNILEEKKSLEKIRTYDPGISLWTGVATKNVEIIKRFGVDANKVKLIPNGVFINPLIECVDIPPIMKECVDRKSFIFTTSSRASSTKGWEQNIITVRRLHEEGYDVSLFLIGSGEYGTMLKNRFEKLDYIHFCETQHNPCDYYFYSNMSFLLSTFSGESAPMSILESLSVGTPVIATDVGDVRNMMTTMEGNIAGSVISTSKCPIDMDAVYDACKKAITDKEWYDHIRKVAHDKIQDVSIANVVKQYEKLYSELIL